MYKGKRVVAIIPALNEEAAIAEVVAALVHLIFNYHKVIDSIIVCDNGSSDRTAEYAGQAGALVVEQTEPGYGVACLTALSVVPHCDYVLFIDGDNSCVVKEALCLLEGLHQGDDLAIGSRLNDYRHAGSMTLTQQFGNRLATGLIRVFWQQPVTDLGPFRAIRYDVLQRLEMQDRRFGWTMEMQLKAIILGLRISEYPVSTLVRIGESKISGTLNGVIKAGYDILTTFFQLSLKARRFAAAPVSKPQPSLVVFCKRPRLHQGKQRLAIKSGAKFAYLLAGALLDCCIEDLKNWKGKLVFAVAHQDDVNWAEQLLPHAEVVFQGNGNLGQRLNRVDQQLRLAGHSALVFVGTDAPLLTLNDYIQYIEAVKAQPFVLSRADDGGVLMMGCQFSWPDLSKLAWSSESLADELISACSDQALEPYFCMPGYDIDEYQDLIKLKSDLVQDPRPSRKRLYRLITQVLTHKESPHNA